MYQNKLVCQIQNLTMKLLIYNYFWYKVSENLMQIYKQKEHLFLKKPGKAQAVCQDFQDEQSLLVKLSQS